MMVNNETGAVMPIADMVYRVLYEGASARRCMQELTTKLI